MPDYKIRHLKKEIKSNILYDGKVAIGVFLGIVISITYNLFANFTKNSESYLDEFPILISLLLAISSTFLASKSLLEQRKSREASTDPILVVHLGQRDDARELITINISNVGAGAALNVRMKVFKPDIDLSKFEIFTDIFDNELSTSIYRPFRSLG